MDFTEDKKNRYLEFDLLSISKIKQKRIPLFFRHQDCWKVFSGKWKTESAEKIVYLREPKVKTGENISIIGSDSWKDFILRVRFNILTSSNNPPEGGLILYFLFKDIRNYYSFHFCLVKQKVEFIKRIQGVWSTIAEKDYNLDIQKYYSTAIKTHSGIHICQIDGKNLIEGYDADITNGCVGIGVKYCDVEFSKISVFIT